MNNQEFNGKGIAIGFAAWFFLIFMMSNETACAKLSSCGGGDLIMNSFLAIGFGFPAWIVANLASGLFEEK